MRAIEKVAFTASARPEAQEALRRLRHTYGDVGEGAADVVVALGGDGHMLDTLRRRMGDARPVYGMNRGTIGFLMNEYHENDLLDRLAAAEAVQMHPLRMRAERVSGVVEDRHAINEVSLLRQTHQTAHLKIVVDGAERMPELSCDGVIVATPAGSTAYNYSAHGPIIPLGANLHALTPISAFRPRRWRGALLPNESQVRIDVLEPQLRPVSASADNQEVRDVAWVEVAQDQTITLTMLFDPDQALGERILAEQFAH